MKVVQEFAFGLKAYAVPVALFLTFLYASYHLMTGERGLWVWYKLNSQIAEITHQNGQLQNRIAYLEKRVHRLQEASLDPDYLDEQARYHLAVMRPNEAVIYLQPQP